MEPNFEQPPLHPIVDDILDAIRKRTEEINGKRVVVEEFVLLDEFIPSLQDKLKSITDELEQKDALLSIFAFCMMVEKQGWVAQAEKIKRLGEVMGEQYHELQRTIAHRLQDQTAQKSQQFFASGSQQAPAPEQTSSDETGSKKVFKPGSDDDFDDL